MKKRKLKIELSAILGAISGALGVIGVLGLCCSSLVITFFAIFGISSVFLMKYNIIFLVIGIFFIGISVVLYLKNKGCKMKK